MRKGRREEFARSRSSRTAARERIPDPQAEATFASAKLGWSDIGHGSPMPAGSNGTAGVLAVRAGARSCRCSPAMAAMRRASRSSARRRARALAPRRRRAELALAANL